MWKLKVAEGQGPWLYSTNNFVGRQIWEFDPDAGTLEEREAVERARDDYQKNRSRVRPSGDVLMRMQLKKENSDIDLSIPPVRLGEKEQVNYEAVTTALKKAVRLNCAIQSKDGHWPAENTGPHIYTPPMLISLYISGAISTVLTAEHKKEMIRYLYNHQVLGVYEWSGCNPLPPEFWLVPSFLPYHPAKMWCYARTTYMPMSYLYGRKYVGPITKLVKSLRQEIHQQPYEEIDWNKARHSCCKGLQMMCWWAEDPNGDEFKYHLARVPDFLWLAEDGMKIQSFGSQLWDCTFLTKAIMASNLVDEYGDTLKKAHFYIKESQVKENPARDFKKMHRHITKGAWTFSDQDQGWAVSDCTSEALKCLLLLSQMPLDVAGEKVDDEQLYEAVDVLLYLHSPKSGGFAIWEPAVPQPYLEVLNPSELFADITVEREYALVLVLSLY
ncbi:hypothetical protein RHMOL_Rhmol02G0260700 [Rhododendron molle]|uniref:Uncharacterized protein n=1 Tax=Rhododendron molle TaxID=49168 RepID=A0ACC0PX02_RHOML|nr:hypothetical protein RHMOL_Rhmol02G0260700 [Rhododendron molle]